MELQPIAKNALTILINISNDQEVLHNLATDDAFLESLLARVTVCQSSNRRTSIKRFKSDDAYM